MYTPQRAYGIINGTGNDIYIELGFKPERITIINETSKAVIEYVNRATAVITGSAANTVNTAINVSERGFTVPSSLIANGAVAKYFVLG